MAEKRFELGKKGTLVIANREYNGFMYVDIRYYAKEGVATKNGTTIVNVDQIEAIGDAIKEAGLAVRAARLNKANEQPKPDGVGDPF